MKSLFRFRIFGRVPEVSGEELPSAASDVAAQVIPALAPVLTVASTIHPVAQAALEQWRSRPASSGDDSGETGHEPTLLSALGWVTAGVGTLAIGLVLGRELRRRYKFIRRTPYDFYAHSGDERDMEFGVGI